MPKGKLSGKNESKGKGKTKGNGKTKVPRNISAALLPSIAFAAVPKTPPPSVSIEEFEPKLTSSLLSSSIIGRLYATHDPDAGSEDETTSINDYLEPGVATIYSQQPGSSLRRTGGRDRFSANRQSEGPYDNPEEEGPRSKDPAQHVYAQVKRRHPDGTVLEESMMGRQAPEQESGAPGSGRHQFKHAAGIPGYSVESRPDLPSRPLLDNVGTLMTSQKDTQEREDLERMVSILRENEEDESPMENGAPERLVDTLIRERREAAAGSSREFEDIDRSVQVSGRTFGDRSETERLIRHLKDEVDVLKKTIYRLNVELTRQLSPRSQSPTGPGGSVKLPGKGPVPSWLVNMRLLSPLLVAYDDKLEEKEAIIKDYDRHIRDFETALKDVVKENERLHIKLENASSAGPTSRSEWELFLEQAKLVLEENQLLLEQLDIQQEKAKAADKEHLVEVSRISKQMIEMEGQKDDLDNELFRLKQRFRDMKGRYDQILAEKENQEDDTTTEIYRAKRFIDELKSAQESETKELLRKLETTQGERRATSEELADVKADRKKLEGEIKGLKKSLKEAHRKNLMLRKFLKKEQTAQEYLDSVLQMAHSLAAERDNCLKMMKDKEAEHNKEIQNIVDEVRVKASIEANRKEYGTSSRRDRKSKSIGKLEVIVKELLEQNEDFRKKHKELEREVIYLQALVKEKEDVIDRVQTEKRNLEDQLETVWQAAINDNKQLRAQLIDTM